MHISKINHCIFILILVFKWLLFQFIICLLFDIKGALINIPQQCSQPLDFDEQTMQHHSYPFSKLK